MSYEDMGWQDYLIAIQVKDKSYVRITTSDFNDRLSEHFVDASTGSRYAFHAAIRQYGLENFTIEILEIADGLAEAKDLEMHYRISLDTRASSDLLSKIRTFVVREFLYANERGQAWYVA